MKDIEELAIKVRDDLNRLAQHMHPAASLKDRAGSLELEILGLRDKVDAIRAELAGKKCYVLISVYDREILTETFGSLKEAQVAMRAEMIKAGVDRKKLYRYDEEFNEVPIEDPEEENVFGESRDGGYVNMEGESDWRIIEIPFD